MHFHLFKDKLIQDIIRATTNRKDELEFNKKKWTISLIEYDDKDYESYINYVKTNVKKEIIGFMSDCNCYDEDVYHFTLIEAIKMLYFIRYSSHSKFYDEISLNYTIDYENSESILYL